jgi:hypothetical protein
MAAGQEISKKRPEAGKAKTRIHVVLNDVKSKVVEPAETPNGYREEQSDFPRRMLEDEEQCRKEADEKKKDALEFNPEGGLQIFHSKDQFTASRHSRTMSASFWGG